MKSSVFEETTQNIVNFYHGAFHSDDLSLVNIQIKKMIKREALKPILTRSDQFFVEFNKNSKGQIEARKNEECVISLCKFQSNDPLQCNPFNGEDIIINVANAPAADVFGVFKLESGGFLVSSIQTKLEKKNLTLSSFHNEMEKAANLGKDHFMLITTAPSDIKIEQLPPQSSLVCQSNFIDFFGLCSGSAFLFRDRHFSLSNEK